MWVRKNETLQEQHVDTKILKIGKTIHYTNLVSDMKECEQESKEKPRNKLTRRHGVKFYD